MILLDMSQSNNDIECVCAFDSRASLPNDRSKPFYVIVITSSSLIRIAGFQNRSGDRRRWDLH
jgi:hypothetical protein